MSYLPEFFERKCPICGAEFIPAPQHVYKIPGIGRARLVCSYNCMRKYQREKEVKK